MSIDGDSGGPNQDLQVPIGVRSFELQKWFFDTQYWRRMHQDGRKEMVVETVFHRSL